MAKYFGDMGKSKSRYRLVGRLMRNLYYLTISNRTKSLQRADSSKRFRQTLRSTKRLTMNYILAIFALVCCCHSGSALKCVNQTVATSGGNTHRTPKTTMECTAGLNTCVHLEMEILGVDTVTQTCGSDALGCDFMCKAGELAGAENCEVSCCGTDLCNNAGIVSANWKTITTLIIASIICYLY